LYKLGYENLSRGLLAQTAENAKFEYNQTSIKKTSIENYLNVRISCCSPLHRKFKICSCLKTEINPSLLSLRYSNGKLVVIWKKTCFDLYTKLAACTMSIQFVKKMTFFKTHQHCKRVWQFGKITLYLNFYNLLRKSFSINKIIMLPKFFYLTYFNTVIVLCYIYLISI
jgi:hypothetical protein